MSQQNTLEDTSRYSYYMNTEYYQNLIKQLSDWDKEGIKVDDATRAEVEQFLFREARLLDNAQMEEWLELFTKDCLYWTPVSPGGGDPTKEITISFDDRRRLEDRIYRIRTGYAWSQVPASRTIRLISNVEVWQGDEEDVLRVRSNFVIHELRAGRMKLLSGWYGHRLRKEDGEWKIVSKQNNLLDSDQSHENLTLLL